MWGFFEFKNGDFKIFQFKLCLEQHMWSLGRLESAILEFTCLEEFFSNVFKESADVDN